MRPAWLCLVALGAPHDKVYQTLIKYDTFVKDLGFGGLAEFQGSGDIVASEGRLRRLKLLVVSPDQEGAGFSALFALSFHFKVLVWTIWDEMHRAHNDIFMAVRASGLRPQVMLCTILFNLSWGPWTSCSWFTRLQEEASAYFSSATHDDPLFKHMLARIQMDDQSFCEALATGQESQEVFDRQPLRKRVLAAEGEEGPHEQVGQLAAVHERVGPMWHRRTLLLLVYWLSHGFCKHTTTKLKVVGNLGDATGSNPKRTMRGQQDDVRATRLLLKHYGAGVEVALRRTALRLGVAHREGLAVVDTLPHVLVAQITLQGERLRFQHADGFGQRELEVGRRHLRLLLRRGLLGIYGVADGAAPIGEVFR